MTDLTPGINHAHAEYVKLTRLQIPLDLGRLFRDQEAFAKFRALGDSL